jgi:hypothetical protein
MPKFYVPRSVTMKIVDDCRSAITRHQGTNVDAGIDLKGIYLDIPNAITLRMAESYFSSPKKDSAKP